MKLARISAPVCQETILLECDDDVATARADEDRLAARDEVDALVADVARELARQQPPLITTWMVMSERERAEIRPPRRRTPEGMLRLVRGGAGHPATPVSDDGEAA